MRRGQIADIRAGKQGKGSSEQLSRIGVTGREQLGSQVGVLIRQVLKKLMAEDNAAFAYCGDAGSGGRWGGRRGLGGSEKVGVVI